MATLLRTALTFAVCLAAIACHSPAPEPLEDGGAITPVSDGGTDAGGTQLMADGGLTYKSACGVLNARRCQYLQQCNIIDNTDTALRDCLAYFTATWCGPSRWPKRVEVGTLLASGAGVTSCADAFVGRSCASWETEPLACTTFLKPNVSPSQNCYGRYLECRDATNVCRGSVCPRLCQPRGAKDDACDEDSDCQVVNGLYCKLSPLNNTGVGTCSPYGLLGAPCSPEALCQSDFYCGSNSQCAARGLPGAPCTTGSCIASAWCQFTQDGGMCAARFDAGTACTDDIQCADAHLCQTLSSECVSVGPLPNGTNCSNRQSCGNGNACVGETPLALGACLPPLNPGVDCVSSNDCTAQLACASRDGGSAKQCGPRLPTGVACTLDRDCQAFARCLGGSCTPLPMPGSPCLSGRCLYGSCATTTLSDGGSICLGFGGPNDACLSDLDCDSNRCMSGRCTPNCAP